MTRFSASKGHICGNDCDPSTCPQANRRHLKEIEGYEDGWGDAGNWRETGWTGR